MLMRKSFQARLPQIPHKILGAGTHRLRWCSLGDFSAAALGRFARSLRRLDLWQPCHYPQIVSQHRPVHLGFTVVKSRRAYVPPATHFASRNTDANLPPMGMRVRLKAAFDISGFPPSTRVILQALKTYGMIVADNGSEWYITGAPDARWNDDDLNAIKSVTGSNFEVVRMGTVVTR